MRVIGPYKQRLKTDTMCTRPHCIFEIQDRPGYEYLQETGLCGYHYFNRYPYGERIIYPCWSCLMEPRYKRGLCAKCVEKKKREHSFLKGYRERNRAFRARKGRKPVEDNCITTRCQHVKFVFGHCKMCNERKQREERTRSYYYNQWLALMKRAEERYYAGYPDERCPS